MTDPHHDRHEKGGCGCGGDHHHPHDHHDEGGCGCGHGEARPADGCGCGGEPSPASEDGGDDGEPRSPNARSTHPDHDEHGHDHAGHNHHHHHHAPTDADGERRVLTILLLTGAFMVVEVIGGLVSGSLALIADAAHMLTDTAALGLAWIAFRLARRPPDSRHSYGWRRFEVLAAYTNGITLFAISVWIMVEAVFRVLTPQPVAADEMMVVAALGLAVNVIGFVVLSGGERRNLNLRGALAHVMGDILGSVAAIGAAIVIRLTGWTPIDPLLSILGAGLILKGAWSLTRESAHILLEGAPIDADAERIETAVREVAGVDGAHHVHIWSLTGERRVATLHAVAAPGTDGDAVLSAIRERLREDFGIGHATIQIERCACADHGHRD